jgi:hypothetical protein
MELGHRRCRVKVPKRAHWRDVGVVMSGSVRETSGRRQRSRTKRLDPAPRPPTYPLPEPADLSSREPDPSFPTHGSSRTAPYREPQ